jgi:two-component sensor histidine kinase
MRLQPTASNDKDDGTARDFTCAEGDSFLNASLECASACAWTYAPDRNCLRWSHSEQADLLRMPWRAASTLPELLATIDPRDRNRLQNAFDGSYAENKPFTSNVRLNGFGDSERWLSLKGGVHQQAPGTVCGICFELPAGCYEADMRRSLDDINHRVKNMFVTISAIAAQSMNADTPVQDYVEHLRGRIRALANLYNILGRSGWRAVGVRSLVTEELMADEATGFAAHGPEIFLKPRAGQALGLALHELAANSRKFGALANGAGTCEIRWSAPWEGRATLELMWKETGIQPGSPDMRRGFGAVVLQEILPQELDAVVSYAVSNGSVRCQIAIPAEWVVEYPPSDPAAPAG